MVDRETLYRTFYGEKPPPKPWATDCPIRFDVWLAFARMVREGTVLEAAGMSVAGSGPAQPASDPLPADVPANLEGHPRVDVILSVSDEFGPARLLERLRGEGPVPRVGLPPLANPIAAGSYVAAMITFAELVRTIIPLTNLARKIVSAQTLGPTVLRMALAGVPFDLPSSSESESSAMAPTEQRVWEGQQLQLRHDERSAHLAWFLRVLAAVVGPDPASIEALAALIESTDASPTPDLPEAVVAARVIDRRRRHPVQSVNLNRQARSAVTRSRITVKADAAEQLFGVDASSLTWAVVDSGIDTTHAAFALRDEKGNRVAMPDGIDRSRVTRTFNLVGARQVMAADATVNGLVDWSQAIPYVEMLPPQPLPGSSPHPNNMPWMIPLSPHGTHVAGILAADWPENELRGICPTLRLFDVRVLDADGGGDEFSIVAALQLIRHLNEQAGRLVVVGVNVSLSVPHDVANHSTGWTPVDVECDRLTRSGVVVVAAAGNAGFEGGATTVGFGFNTVSISDPGNTDSVITVGSTHRSDPHRHGVSYFSSRGPTADGRQKPDLLAPGEDIDGPVPGGGLQAMHGTSQAAAHVSGAAAMLMARHRELIGRPERIKEILCRTATDLGRERSFQGHGLVDALRAMQSI